MDVTTPLRRFRTLALGLVFAFACGEQGNPEPVLRGVVPSTVTSLSSTLAVIEGENFFAQAHVDLNSKKGATTSRGEFRVVIGDGEALDTISVSPRRIEFEVPAGLAPGVHDLTLVTPGQRSLTLPDALTVLDDQGLTLSIEDASEGSGAAVDGQKVKVGGSLVLHSVGRRGNDFLMPIGVDWATAGAGASLSDSSGERSTFSALTPGSESVVTISHPTYQSVSATISVVECLVDADCQDPCRSTNACVSDACVQGPVDKDVDGDGALDASCPGGTDCDDSLDSCTTDCTNADGDALAACAGDCDDSAATGATCTSGCSVFFADTDVDTFGDPSNPSSALCVAPSDFVANSGDCDDGIAACTTDCTDADTDGVAACAGDCDDSPGTGEDCSTGCSTFFADVDGDGFGNLTAISTPACVAPTGFVANSTDCDDNPVACGGGCFPGNPANDICDGDNQDCDGSVDEDPNLIWFQDEDSDGFGQAVVTQNACNQPVGFVANSTDCDDDPSACGSACFPGNAAADICDGNNQDCDAALDEDPEIVWFEDADGDGFGNLSSTLNACTQPLAFVANDTDCDDNPLACGALCFPGNVAADVCDSDNQDCDALVDEDPELVWFEDADGDSFGNAASTTNACIQPVGFVDDNLDCADDPAGDPVCGGLNGNFCNPSVAEGPAGDATCSDNADNDCDTRRDALDPDCDDGTITVTLRFNNQGISEDLINFPVLVSLNPSNFDYATADPLGGDLIFEDEDGSTVLPHEIDVWNPGGESSIWVLVPQIDADSVTDHIFLRYGDLASAPLEDPDSLWSAYHAVWHLEETGDQNGDDYLDSSPQNNHGQGGGGIASRVPSPTPGVIGNGQLFDGDNDRILIDPSDSFNFTSNAVTMEYWAIPNFTGGAMVALGKGGSPTGYRTGIELFGRIAWFVGGSPILRTATETFSGTLHLVVTWNGTNMRIYVNGVLEAESTESVTIGSSASDFFIGRGPTGFEFRGVIDEARVADEAFSGPWIEAQFRTQAKAYITFE
jgi:hypothetical protein